MSYVSRSHTPRGRTITEDRLPDGDEFVIIRQEHAIQASKVLSRVGHSQAFFKARQGGMVVYMRRTQSLLPRSRVDCVSATPWCKPTGCSHEALTSHSRVPVQNTVIGGVSLLLRTLNLLWTPRRPRSGSCSGRQTRGALDSVPPSRKAEGGLYCLSASIPETTFTSKCLESLLKH